MAGRAFPQPRRSVRYSGVQLEAKAIKSETEEAINDEDLSHYLSSQAVSEVIGRIRKHPSRLACSQMSIRVGKQEQVRDECLISRCIPNGRLSSLQSFGHAIISCGLQQAASRMGIFIGTVVPS
jgi:hypothetical protein